jgi:hypothetical protein
MQTIFKGKVIKREMILKAMQDFDEAYPDPNQYEGWLDKRQYKYEVLHNGRRYPPKHILSRASGVSVQEFNGGEETNRVFRALGFKVERK